MKNFTLNSLLEHVLFPIILSGLLTFLAFIIVLIFSGSADWDYLICLTIFGAAGYESVNIINLKFPDRNIAPIRGMFIGWIFALMLLLRVSMHSI